MRQQQLKDRMSILINGVGPNIVATDVALVATMNISGQLFSEVFI